VQGCVLVIALCYVGANFLTDALYAIIDPRVRT
jgi:ABC-type dipeptide/oligopeptide/nickel transport system permease component